MSEFFDKSYYENGPQTGKSLYQNYRWIPELTIPLAHHIAIYAKLDPSYKILDFGCAKGYLVYALRLLGYDAWGVDISEYAISKAPKEVSDYVRHIKPYSDNFNDFDVILCKDILEHIPYDMIDKQLSILRQRTDTVWAIIPLGADGKYIIPAYELDKSHYIRESKEWWEDKFMDHGFTVEATTNLGPFKAQWQEVNTEGNVLITAY